MRLASSLVLACVVACSGKSAVVEPATSSGGAGGDDGGGGSICTTEQNLGPHRVCLPAPAKSGVALTIVAEDDCGTCGQPADRCNVVVSDKNVFVTLGNDTCKSAATCPDICARGGHPCTIPPLEAGSYAVIYRQSKDVVKKLGTLDVLDDGTATSCMLAASRAVDATSFDQSCVQDSDCAAVATKVMCGPACFSMCPDTAVNARSAQNVTAQRDAQIALCEEPPALCPGPPCTPTIVRCDLGKCRLLPK